MSKLIAVDAGHGLHTPGKRTPDGEREWSFNNKVVIALIDELHRLGLRTVRLDDPSGQRDVPLGERTRKANNAKADVLVSVHHNAVLRSGWGNHTGTETYSYPKSTEGAKLSRAVQTELVKAYGLRDRKKKVANFHMLRESKMPAILTEGGYMDSSIDIVKLRDNEVLKQAGINIARGVANYLGLSVSGEVKPDTSTPPKKPAQPKKQAGTGGSIVDYLISKKINSSFANRKKLAREYLGISNYSGTAKQNTDLLNAMRSGKKEQPKATNNNVSNYKGGSIVDYLNLSGNKHLGGSSFSNRKKLAETNGIRGYTGTAAQNKQLLLKLQGGSVATPTRSVNVNAIAEQIKKGIDNKGKKIPTSHEPRRKHFGLTADEYKEVRSIVNNIM